MCSRTICSSRSPVGVDYRRHLHRGVGLGSHGQDHIVINVVSMVEPVAAGRADQTVNDVDEGVLEHHLGGRRVVEPILRIALVTNVLNTKDRIGVPHIFGRYGWPEDADELRGIGLAM